MMTAAFDQQLARVEFMSREDLAQYRTRRYVEAELLGRRVRVQSITEAERSALALRGDEADSLARQIALALVDEKGRRLFSDDAEDLAFLSSLDSAVTWGIQRILDRHWGSIERSDKDATVEAAAKN